MKLKLKSTFQSMVVSTTIESTLQYLKVPWIFRELMQLNNKINWQKLSKINFSFWMTGMGLKAILPDAEQKPCLIVVVYFVDIHFEVVYKIFDHFLDQDRIMLWKLSTA